MNRCGQPCSLKLGKGAAARVQQRPNVGPRVSAGPCGGLRRAAERAYLRGKWSKQLKTVGHLTIPKWIPDQENPTEALQKGAFKKSKGRKRGAGEVGRMTRSVRQHLDAPLELLSEYPVRVHASRQSSPARATTVSSAPARTPVPMPSPDGMSADAGAAVAAPVGGAVPTNPAESVKMESAAPAAPLVAPPVHPAVPTTAPKAEVVPAAPAANVSTAPAMPMMPLMPPVANQMMAEVPSDEQLEMALDDLPMLDADDSFNLDALDPAFLPTPAPSGVPLMDNAHHPSGASSKQQSAENSSASVSEDDGSANSGSSIPSASPQSSPGMMSRSPSP
ncbi:putative CTD small phosphatase-like protein [Phytophthora cinnamomi]|uniref:putative CTD small phosphatase-like protein n=1 Tax=Phytophthora cinnamomi TaxID=4785 RepID=UPI00355941BF|nr:putative CTD small phosphatase-like protein [Phytophthora cinnamomi]